MGSCMQRRPEPELMDLHEEAEAYAVADFAEVNDRFVRRLTELAGPVVSARAVDLGTGPADIPIRVVRARPSWHVTAVDGSQAMLNLARAAVEKAGLSASIELVLADAKATSLPGGAFDLVFSNSILHHINDVDPLWAEVKRLGNPGAVVFLRDLARPSSEKDALDLVEKYSGDESDLLKEEFYRSLLAAYTPGEVRAQLERSGLSGLEVEMASDRHLDVFGRLP